MWTSARIFPRIRGRRKGRAERIPRSTTHRWPSAPNRAPHLGERPKDGPLWHAPTGGFCPDHGRDAGSVDRLRETVARSLPMVRHRRPAPHSLWTVTSVIAPNHAQFHTVRSPPTATADYPSGVCGTGSPEPAPGTGVRTTAAPARTRRTDLLSFDRVGTDQVHSFSCSSSLFSPRRYGWLDGVTRCRQSGARRTR